MAIDYYRGGPSLVPRRRELKFDPATGDVLPERGVSVLSSPGGLEPYGGAYRVTNVPPELRIIQHGKNPDHYEIIPVRPMPLAEYVDALGRIRLVPV
jgi:hypothetical protein